jgi:hypothetical protein
MSVLIDWRASQQKMWNYQAAQLVKEGAWTLTKKNMNELARRVVTEWVKCAQSDCKTV